MWKMAMGQSGFLQRKSTKRIYRDTIYMRRVSYRNWLTCYRG